MLKFRKIVVVLFCFLSFNIYAQNSAESNGIEIPNVFTPNQDKKNDVFEVKSKNLQTLNIEIYSRWGNKIAELKGINDCWDGKATSGEDLPEGNYFYQLNATDLDGKKITINGVVLLLR